MSLFEPMIGLTGEIELEKGGPGSGPRPGQRNRQGSAAQTQKPASTMFEHPGVNFNLTLAQADSVSHPGKDASEDVKALLKDPSVASQFANMNPDHVRDELKQYGAWNAEELKDNEANKERLLWVGAGHIKEENSDVVRKVVVGFGGEIELEKGGPGSGPRPGGKGPFPNGTRVDGKSDLTMSHSGERGTVVGSPTSSTHSVQWDSGHTSEIAHNMLRAVPMAPDNKIRIKGGRPNAALRSNGGTAF